MPTRSQPDLVFYDGGCGLCHRAVSFLVARDRKGTLFAFAPLGGPTFVERVDEGRRASLPDSIVVLTPDDELLVRSRAMLFLLRRLGSGWEVLARAAGCLPTSLLDRAYDFIASVRLRLFAKPDGACPLLPPELRSRFLP